MIIWLASYPRSGNTFIRIILNNIYKINTYSLYNDISDIGADHETAEVVGHKFLPEDFDIEKARKSEDIFFVKTHDAPVNDDDKAIYIVRDGRGSTISYFNYQKSFFDSKDSLSAFIYGDTKFGIWSDHLKLWDPQQRKNTLLLRYEDLISDFSDSVTKISSFLQLSPVNNDMPSFDELHDINPRFFNSGKINSWKEVFKAEEHNAFWLKNYSQMIKYGYVEDMPDIFRTNDDYLNLIHLLSQENTYHQQVMISKMTVMTNKLIKKEKIITEKEMLLHRNAKNIREKANQIREKDNQIRQKDNQIRFAVQHLDRIRNHRAYKLAQVCKRMINRVTKVFRQ